MPIISSFEREEHIFLDVSLSNIIRTQPFKTLGSVLKKSLLCSLGMHSIDQSSNSKDIYDFTEDFYFN